MADGPPDGYDYDPAHDINTDEGWLKDDKGNPIMGGGVQVNLEGLQGYSQKVYQIHQNFNGMAGTLVGPMKDMALGAFGTPGQGLPWATAMASLVGHNISQLMDFNKNISIGVMNVAYAAQTVANVFGDTDAGSAANLQAIDFAFGNRKAAPDSVPQYVLDNVPTWEEFQKDHPEVAAQMGPGVTPIGGVPVTNGDTTTTKVVIPQAGGPPIVMETTQRVWTTPAGYSGVVTTVKMNGKVQTVTSTTSNGYSTTTQVTTSYYDKDGNHQRDRVTSESTETWRVQGSGATTTTVTDTETTSYTYNDKGEQTNSTTTNQTVAVGAELPDVPLPDPREDPLYKERMGQLPQPG
jgi:hypothetical protein